MPDEPIPTARLFIAIRLDQAMAHALADHAAATASPGLKPTHPDNLHLTLKFLGDTPRSMIDALADALQSALAPVRPFNLRCTGRLLALPSPSRPRVLAAAVDPADTLADVARRADAACRDIGLPAEARPFRPHVTLARFGRRAGPAIDAHALASLGAPLTGLAAHAPAASLIESTLASPRPRHRALAALPFAARGLSP